MHIGSQKIHLASAQKGAQGAPMLGKHVSVDLPRDSIQNGLIMDSQKLAQAVKGAVTEHFPGTKQVALSIYVPGIVNRVSDCPQMSKKEMKEALKAEVQKYTRDEKVVFDCFPVGLGRAAWVAITKDTVNSYINMCKEAGLDIVSLDTLQLAALRGLGDKLPAQDSLMLILMHDSAADVSILQAGTPAYARALDTDDVSTLMHDIRLTRDYWEEEQKRTKLSKVVILDNEHCGEKLAQDLPEFLGSLTVERAQELQVNQNSSGLFGYSALGAAFKGLTARSYDINLLPEEKIRLDKWKNRFLNSLAYWALLLLATVVISLVLWGMTHSYQTKVAKLNTSNREAMGVMHEWEEVVKERAELNNVLADRKSIVDVDAGPEWSGVLKDISKMIPPTLWLTHMEFEKGSQRLLLRGRSRSPEDVYQYVRLLGYSKYFYDPKVGRMESSDEDNTMVVRFEISCPYRFSEEGALHE